MATYTELYDLRYNSSLINKVVVACSIAAKAIIDEDGGTANHAERVVWATSVLEGGGTKEAAEMYRILIAANEAATIATIEGATDATIQTNVNDHINFFATG